MCKESFYSLDDVSADVMAEKCTKNEYWKQPSKMKLLKKVKGHWFSGKVKPRPLMHPSETSKKRQQQMIVSLKAKSLKRPHPGNALDEIMIISKKKKFKLAWSCFFFWRKKMKIKSVGVYKWHYMTSFFAMAVISPVFNYIMI